MSSDQRFREELLKTSSNRNDVFQRGYDAGYAKAREELAGEVASLAAETIEKTSANLEELAEFGTAVQVAKACSELEAMKVSMQKGICWQCHTRPRTKTSAYGRCEICDHNDEESR